jgi:hypothetical protein
VAERLQILGPCGWWNDGVRSARYSVRPGEPVPVAVVLGPEVDGEALERWRERGAPWIGRRTSGVLSLLGVERAGRRTAWVYEDCDGVSVGAAIAAGLGPLPLRVAAQLVARCAEILEPLAAEGRIHPGPDADDVLVLARGDVLLAGFVGPYARSPIHRAPGGVEDTSAVVWRLGVLLAALLTGARPTPAADRVAHDLVIRRMLIRIMSRPGPMFPERYRDWLVGMLSWDAEARPLLSRVAPGLRELAAVLPSPDLPDWAGRRIPELRGRAPTEPLSPIERPLDKGSTEVAPALPDPTEETTLPDTPDEDDVTAVSSDGDPPLRWSPPPEHGTIPVHVGPPPEAVPRLTRLPDELFRTPAPVERTESTERTEILVDRRPPWIAMTLAMLLLALATVLCAYLWQ